MENETGPNTDFRKVGGVLAWVAGVAGPLFAFIGVFSHRSSEVIEAGAVIGYATFVVGTLLFFSRRGIGAGVALLVLALVAFFAAVQLEAEPLIVFAVMVLTSGVFALIGQFGAREDRTTETTQKALGFGKKMVAKAQRMAAAAKQPDAGDANDTKS